MNRQFTKVSSVFTLCATLWLMALITVSRTAAAQSVQFEEIGGTLPDGTEFLIRVPQNWNGTVINDLDYAQSPNSAFRMYWLGQGTRLRAPSAILCGGSSMIRWVRSRTR